MPEPGAIEYVYTQQVAWPTGGTVRAGTRVWLTPQQLSRLDWGIRGVLCDVAEWERRKAALKTNDTTRAKPAGLSEVGRAELTRRRARIRRQLQNYATTMIDQDEGEDK